METIRFVKIKSSKFNYLSNENLQYLRGGICLKCKKRNDTVDIGLTTKDDLPQAK